MRSRPVEKFPGALLRLVDLRTVTGRRAPGGVGRSVGEAASNLLALLGAERGAGGMEKSAHSHAVRGLRTAGDGLAEKRSCCQHWPWRFVRSRTD